MFHGVLALVGRSLRVDSRSVQSHLARFGLMVAIYVALCVAQWNSTSFGAPGLRFFYGIGYLNLTFMTLLGLSFFSTSISEEKEEDTLGLMLMAGISPLGVLIGKSGGRLAQALLLIAVQYPFTLLAITMGGVTQAQVSAVYLAMAAYLVLLAGFGLLCSTIGSNNRSAATYMTIGLLAYVLIPRLAAALVAFLTRNGAPGAIQAAAILDPIIRFSVFEQMGWILTTGFGDPRFSWQVISNLSTGLLCFGLAWALFGLFSRQPGAEATTRGLIARSHGRLRWFSPGRPWANPFLWKDYYFVSGGLGMIPARLAFCLGLYGIALLQNNFQGGGPRNLYMDVSFYQVFLSFAVSIDAARLLARSISDEIRGQTLSSLMMLPESTVALFYSKFAGALIGWLPGIVVEIVITAVTDQGRKNFAAVISETPGFYITTYFILIPHLAVVLSTYLRWGAVPLSVVISIGSLFGSMTILQSKFPIRPNEFMLIPSGMFILAICVMCHIVLYARLKQLAEV
jgi:ABC-type transport system involved in multi-copper enzyme maturation permease subunit